MPSDTYVVISSSELGGKSNMREIGYSLAFFGSVSFLLVGAAASSPERDANATTRAPFTSEVHEVPTLQLDANVLTIAARYREAIKRGGSISVLNTPIICEIADDGHVAPDTCEANSWRDSDQVLAMIVARSTPLSMFPKFLAIDRAALGLAPRGTRPLWSNLVNYGAFGADGGQPPFYRLAKLAVSIARISTPKVDLASGPLVDWAEIELESGKAAGSIDYPPRAIRDNRDGIQTVECQVQEDRSVICKTAAFDPPENESYFEDLAKRLFMHAIVKERLKSGNPASGVRFRNRLRWVLPSEG